MSESVWILPQNASGWPLRLCVCVCVRGDTRWSCGCLQCAEAEGIMVVNGPHRQTGRQTDRQRGLLGGHSQMRGHTHRSEVLGRVLFALLWLCLAGHPQKQAPAELGQSPTWPAPHTDVHMQACINTHTHIHIKAQNHTINHPPYRINHKGR